MRIKNILKNNTNEQFFNYFEFLFQFCCYFQRLENSTIRAKNLILTYNSPLTSQFPFKHEEILDSLKKYWNLKI